MILRCMTCKSVLVGNPKSIVGCQCDPDAPTWVAIDRDERIIGGTYRYYIPLEELPND